MYIYMQKIIKKIKNFPREMSEFLWAKKITGVYPYEVEWSQDDKNPSFIFKNGPVRYFCSAKSDGKYGIGNVDTDGFLKEKQHKYKRRAILIQKYLGKRPENCSKEEAVLFCAKAVTIERGHKKEEIEISGNNLIGVQHSIISFG